MKKTVVILILGFLLAFAGSSQANPWRCGYRYGYCHYFRPVPVVAYHPCRIWIGPHWIWSPRIGRRVWVRGYWR